MEEDGFLDACHSEGVDGTFVEAVGSCGSIVSEVDGVGGAGDVDKSGTVVDGVVDAAIVDEGGHETIGVDACASQSAAALHGAADAATGDGDGGVPLDAASGVVDVESVTSTTPDAAVVLLRVFAGADVGTLLDGGVGVPRTWQSAPPPKVEP